MGYISNTHRNAILIMHDTEIKIDILYNTAVVFVFNFNFDPYLPENPKIQRISSSK